jgi:hypothetical protein
MLGVQRNVLGCLRGVGTVITEVWFAGDGHVLSARALPPGELSSETTIADEAVLECVGNQVARASVAPFRKDKFVVRFPYRVR